MSNMKRDNNNDGRPTKEYINNKKNMGTDSYLKILLAFNQVLEDFKHPQRTKMLKME